MPTTKAQIDQIQTELAPIGDFTYRAMMGEYLVYYEGVYIGGIYDGIILLKDNPELEKYHLTKKVPYTNAKAMHILDHRHNPQTAEILQTARNYFLAHPPKKSRRKNRESH